MTDRVRENVCVILVVVDVANLQELEEFFRHLSNWKGPAHRCLIKIGTPEEARTLARLMPTGIEVHVLTRIDPAACPIPGATIFTMPSDFTEAESDNLVLAMSDAVWLPSTRPMSALQERAHDNGKIVMSTYGLLPWVPRNQSQQHVDDLMKLDPQTGRVWFLCCWGRAELLLIALLAFIPTFAGLRAIRQAVLEIRKVWGSKKNDASSCRNARTEPVGNKKADAYTRGKVRNESIRKLFNPFFRPFSAILGWRNYDPYFGPRKWRRLCPDIRLRTRDAQPAMMVWFDIFERAGGSGARCYRDLNWVAHLLAGAAVWSALAGALSGEGETWSIVEMVTLLGIAGVVRYGSGDLQRRWMACRLGAEELRASILCTSLFATPDLLLQTYRAQQGKRPSRFAAATADSIAARVLRDHGLSNLEPDYTSVKAAEWVSCIAKDQLDYHRRNHTRLERLESAVKVFGYAVFFAVLGMVIWHFMAHHLPPWVLFVTAGGPAAAAAFHGAMTQLNVVDRSKSSEECAVDLEAIVARLDKYLSLPNPPLDDWRFVRRAAVETANVMSKEVEVWHAVLGRRAMTLPA